MQVCRRSWNQTLKPALLSAARHAERQDVMGREGSTALCQGFCVRYRRPRTPEGRNPLAEIPLGVPPTLQGPQRRADSKESIGPCPPASWLCLKYHALFEVNLIPVQSANLALSKSGIQGEGDNCLEERIGSARGK